MIARWRLPDEAATRRAGYICGRAAQGPGVIALEGPLGAGKTTFVQGLAGGLGVREATPSPTFVIAAEYKGSDLTLVHIDLYRLQGEVSRMVDWLDEYLYGDAVCAVEWADVLADALPVERLQLRLLRDGGERSLQARATGAAYEEWLDRWQRWMDEDGGRTC
jgi:tRNA threonylcarbamoyladenosine biosynthesis protein TsaE